MALRKTLARRLFSFSISKIRAAATVPEAATCPCSRARREPPLLLHLLQRRPIFQAAVPPDRLAALPTGERLIQKILSLGGGGIRLDGILPPVLLAPPEAAGMTVAEVRKVLKAAQLEAARARLRAVPESCVSYSEFLQICCEVSSKEQGPGIARSLDESGAVIVLGDAVLLRPDQELEERLHIIDGTVLRISQWGQISVRTVLRISQWGQISVIVGRRSTKEQPYESDVIEAKNHEWVHFGELLDGTLVDRRMFFFNEVAKAIQSLIMPPTTAFPQSDGRSSELREMEEKKAVIDKKATDLVRAELWGGLGFLALQTVGFMRLTFWELSWDTMEPICFFATSLYLMMGYAFFMRTSKEPSFEGFFQARFAAKQKHLMKAHNFDPLRFNELKRAFPYQPSEELTPPPSYQHCNR